jgi:hypothetical protein
MLSCPYDKRHEPVVPGHQVVVAALAGADPAPGRPPSHAVSPRVRWPLFLPAPLRPAFSRLPLWREMFEWLILTVNSGLIVFSLYHFSVFVPPAQADAAYDREWERWAAPTIIVLILSAAAAVVVAGVS